MRKLLLIIVTTLACAAQIDAQGPMSRLIRKQASTPAGCADSDAQKFIDSTGISGADATAICTLVTMLKDSSLWSKMDIIYPFISSTATPQRYNLKNPATFKLTFNGSWTHSSTGADPGGTSSDYANTGYEPAVSGTMTTSSTHLSIDIVENSTGGGADPIDIGAYTNASQAIIISAKNGGNILIKNLSTNHTVSNSNSIGYYITSKTATNDADTYKAGSNVMTNTSSGGALPNSTTIFLGNMSIGGSPYAAGASGRKMDFATAGSGLTAGEAATLSNIVSIFKTAIGR